MCYFWSLPFPALIGLRNVFPSVTSGSSCCVVPSARVKTGHEVPRASTTLRIIKVSHQRLGINIIPTSSMFPRKHQSKVKSNL